MISSQVAAHQRSHFIDRLMRVPGFVNYPDAMTHASVRGTEAAVPVEVVRLSVGIEDVDDLLADVEQALSA